MSITLESVTFRYAGTDTEAIKNIDLKVKQGEILGIFGAIGSGKTTLLLTLNGFVPKEAKGTLTGNIIVDGLDVNDHTIAEMVKHVGMVLPDPTLSIIGMTVEDDLAFSPTWLGFTTDEIRERVAWAARMVRLEGYEKRNTSYLSGGEQQALCIGGVLAMKPRIFALDEPITMLDPVGKSRIMTVINELNHELGSTILISEGGTDIDYISPLLDRCVVLREGEILLEGKPEKIFAEEELLKSALVSPPQASQLTNRLNRIMRIKTTKTTIEIKKTSHRTARLLKKLGKRWNTPLRRHSKSVEAQKNPIISIENLCHHFQGSGVGAMALDGINLEVDAGEFIALLGRNGSGKTTLSLHLVGELKPTNPDAKIIVDDIDLLSKDLNQKDLLEHINYVFQNPDDQIFSDTVWEEITFGLEALGLPEKELKSRAQETLEFFDLTGIRDKPTLYLTRDEKTFVATASIAALKPKILIVDEPTKGLDQWKSEEMMRKLQELNRKTGTTLIIITHNMPLVARYAERAVVLRTGKVYMDGTPREILSETARLRNASLSPPPITQIAQSLSKQGFPKDIQSVEEFLEVLGLGGDV